MNERITIKLPGDAEPTIGYAGGEFVPLESDRGKELLALAYNTGNTHLEHGDIPHKMERLHRKIVAAQLALVSNKPELVARHLDAARRLCIVR